MLEVDEQKSVGFLRMSEEQWKGFAKKAIAERRGRGNLRPLLNWLDSMEEKRASQPKASTTPVVRDMDPDAVMFRVWKDMVLEPAKYGPEDWQDWVVMDAQLKAGPKRWRIAAFWREMDDAEEARVREASATRIQAAWRGHVVRDTQEGLNCEDCLARTFAPQQWNGERLCVGCLEHRFEHFSSYVQPVVLPPPPPSPAVEPDEHGYVPCEGCGRVVVYEGDYGDYRPGWWCSRACAYDL
jgi:hypothetical protein